MSAFEPFDADKIISLWTKLLKLQIDIGYYPRADSISFPPPEGRNIDETVCNELGLSSEVISLMKRLPCPSNFDEAWETTIFDESIAVPFTDSEWIVNSRDPVNRWVRPIRQDYMNPEDIALVVDKDESGYQLILDTKANTARYFNDWEVDEGLINPERPDDSMHYRNYPPRPAIEVVEELVAKFRDLEWIPMRRDGTWPQILTVLDDECEYHPQAYTKAKNILRTQFGWPDNFDKERWDRERNDIWKEIMEPEGHPRVVSKTVAQHLSYDPPWIIRFFYPFAQEWVLVATIAVCVYLNMYVLT
ncbi:hypothetical protein NX059_001885 [Plenodomus lindquistii]|nr:hypothetical protein NX059_001885 [Plenodomus lindquistii]